MGFTALMYHSLSDGRHPDRLYGKYTTTLKTFREHLSALKDGGYRLCSVREVLNAYDAGQSGLHHTCVMTFDDGHRSSLDFADALSEAGVHGTFFLTSRYCREREDFLKSGEIQDLAARGFDFGTHGVTHRPLRCLEPNALKGELVDSKHWLEDVVGAKVDSMSLPAGQGSAAVSKQAYAEGYRVVGNSVERGNGVLKIPGEVNRFAVLSSHSAETVVRIASASPSYIWRRKMRAAALWLPKKLLRTYHRTRPES